MFAPEFVVFGSGIAMGSASTVLAVMPRLIRAAQLEGEVKQLRENFDRALGETESRAKLEGFIDGKRLTEEDLWSGFERHMFPHLESHHTFPLRKRTVIEVRERLTFRKFTLAWETVVSITLTRDIASATELAEYIARLIAPLIPVATHIALGA